MHAQVPGTRPRIFILDDEPQIIDALEDLLEDDYDVEGETSASRALERIAGADPFYAILCDQRMPEMNGDEFLKRAQRHTDASRILITGYADLNAVIRAVNDGRIYGYLTKPWDPGALQGTLRGAVDACGLHRALLSERALFADLMTCIPDGVFITDAAGRYERLNLPESVLLGVESPDRALGRTLAELVPSPLAATWGEAEAAVLSGRMAFAGYRRRVEHPGGVSWYDAHIAARRDDSGGAAGLVGVSRDVTELVLQAERLETANRHLLQTNREQAEFTYALSHDLRAPATTLGMVLDEVMVSDGAAMGEEGRESLAIARALVGRMRRLIDDVGVYARSIGTPLEAEPVPLGPLIGEILADLRGDILRAGAGIEVGALPVVEGNAMQLRLLFQNLIANAIKFRSPDRVPAITVACATSERDGLCVTVRDNGIGIDPQFHASIFGLFKRLHTQEAFPGSGLGLAICARVVANHDGRIAVRSTPGEGAAFDIFLPTAEALQGGS